MMQGALLDTVGKVEEKHFNRITTELREALCGIASGEDLIDGRSLNILFEPRACT